MASLKNILTDGALTELITKIKIALKGKSDTEHTHTKSDVGLGNVDNIADSAKSVASAAKLTTARTIAISGGATGTATSFNGSANISIPITDMKEAYLSWGGKNLSNAVSPVDAGMCEAMSANRLSFMSPDGITAEYSTDGGNTWVDYGATDIEKTNLVTNVSTTTNFFLGHGATASTDNQLRITISAKEAGIYFKVRKVLIFLANNSNPTQVDIEKSTIGSPTTFTSLVSNVGISGNSGWNSISLGECIFGGTGSSLVYALRFTFHSTSVKTANAMVKRIFMFGETMWTSTNQMQVSNRAYSVGSDKTANFMGDVKASNFVGALTGNASSATKATQDSAGQQINTTYIKELSVDGQTINYTKGDGTTENAELADIPIAYGICDTNGSVAEKEITIQNKDNFELKVGTEICVKFSATNTASNCTLNVNGTGAKQVWYGTVVCKDSTTAALGKENLFIRYVYDGTYWVCIGKSNDANTSYSVATTSANGLMSKEDKAKLDKADDNMAYLPLSGGTMTGDIVMQEETFLKGVTTPTDSNHAANKQYVDDKVSAVIPKIYSVSIPSTAWTWNSDTSSGTATIALADCTADWNPIVYLDTSTATSETLSDMTTCFNGITACETAAGSITFTTVVEPTLDISVYLHVSGAVIVEG